MAHLEPGYLAAVEEGRKSAEEGGIPVGSAIVDTRGNIIGRGHNERVQTQSVVLHGETSAFESAKHLPLSAFKGATIFTTLSPCPMCAGAMLFFGVSRVVIGENVHMRGQEEMLRGRGLVVEVLNREDSKSLMDTFLTEKGHLWEETIPEDG